MNLTTVTLIGTTTVGTPSGNYDGSTNYFVDSPEKAVGYYAGQGSIQTAFIRVTNFTGIITLQATLNDNPDQALWFDVYEYGDASSIVTDYHPVTLTGNFCFMRAKVTNFDAGTIEFVKLSY